MHIALPILVVVSLSAGEPDFPADPVSIACGPTALSLSAQLLERELTAQQLSIAFQNRLSGMHSLPEIAEAAHSLGMSSLFVKHDPRHPDLARLPLIAVARRSEGSNDHSHFVVLYGQHEGALQVLDFPQPPRWVSVEEFAQEWNGDGLYLASKPGDLATFPSSWNPRTWALVFTAGGVGVIGLYRFIRSGGGPLEQGNSQCAVPV